MSEAFAGQYKIDREIGRGGMATVYLAEDIRHGRPVAIKVLHAETGAAIGAERFLREIQVVARLRHPHIVPLYDSGEAGGRLYYVMPYVKGESVRDHIRRAGAFTPDEALRLTSEVADALAYAHSEGVIHRDIKPDNIMLDERHALVMDFGIARALTEGPDSASSLTGTGFLVGTPAYMSPEQVTGEANIDGRSDIYSLGCVLFEMLAGSAPFTGPSPNSVMAKRFASPRPSLDAIEQPISPAVKNVLTTAMSLAASERFQTAREMAKALDDARLASPLELAAIPAEAPAPIPPATPATGRPSKFLMPAIGALVLAGLAIISLSLRKHNAPAPDPSSTRAATIGVLPFANQSPDKQMQYFTDGLTDELISALSHVNGLEVAGRASSYAIRGEGLDAQQAANRLQVRYLVDAGVRADGSRVRVTWQLIDGRTGKGLGSGDIDGEAKNVIALQDSMAKKIVQGLSSVIGSASPGTLPRHQTANYEAHDFYLKGHFYWNQRTAETMRLGITYLKQAIEKDSSYALAWAELASAYTLEPAFGDMRPSDVLTQARAAAKKAVELDPSLSEANTAMGMSLTFNDRDPQAALVYIEKAIAQDPRNSFPHLFHTWPLLMMGRSDEAIEELRKARSLDPLSTIINTRLGSTLIWVRKYDEAITELRKALAVDPANLMARIYLGKALAGTGHYDDAFKQFPDDAIDAEAGLAAAGQAWAYDRGGNAAAARNVFDRLQARSRERYIDALSLAGAAASSGQQQLGLDYLEQALREHSIYLVFLRVDPSFDRLRSDPRYKAVLQEVEKKYPHN